MNPPEQQRDVVLDLVWSSYDVAGAHDLDFSWNLDGDVVRDLLTDAG